MTIYASQSIAEKLKAGHGLFVLIDGNRDLQQSLAQSGYSAERLDEGRTLLAQLVALHDAQQKEYAEQYASTARLKQLRGEADGTFERLFKSARVAVGDDLNLQNLLGLTDHRKTATSALSGWLEQATSFYRRALASPTALERLAASFQVSREQLEAGLAQCEAVRQASVRQIQQTAEAQESTRRRDAVNDQLQKWSNAFVATARITLMDQPEKLQMLGIKP